nr:hypothetical protein Iba_chr04eCG3940 [Ipomoea batatas]
MHAGGETVFIPVPMRSPKSDAQTRNPPKHGRRLLSDPPFYPSPGAHGRDSAVPMISSEAGSLPPIYARRLKGWGTVTNPPNHPAGPPEAPGTGPEHLPGTEVLEQRLFVSMFKEEPWMLGFNF